MVRKIYVEVIAHMWMIVLWTDETKPQTFLPCIQNVMSGEKPISS